MAQGMSISFHGAARRVTGSCSLVRCGAKTILVDCGLIQGDKDADALNREGFAFDAAALDAVLLTHGHLDHVGRVPLLLAAGFRGPIITHAASAQIAEIVLRDTVHLSAREDEPLYDDALVNRTVQRFQAARYGETVALGDVKLRLFDAGHILGSAHVLVESGKKRLLLSGDVGQPDTPIIRDPTTQWKDPVDAVVIESTYGNRQHRGRRETEQEFKEIIHQAVAHKGVVLIPAFAIGRTQEILYQFNKLAEAGEIPRLPVLLDSPMAGRVTGVYRAHQDCYDQETWDRLERGRWPMSFPELREIVNAEESKAVKKMAPPFVVVAGSGMCSGGRILHHLANFLDRKSTTVIFVGFQGGGTLGRRLVDGEKRVGILGREVQVQARIETLNGFSAHADVDGLLAWAKAIPGPPGLFLVAHGEEEAATGLARTLTGAGFAQAVAVSQEQTFEI